MSREILGIVERAARRAGVREVEVLIGESRESLTRFANNAIHQNVAEQDRQVSIRVIEDHRTARVSTNRTDRDALEAAVGEAIEIARSSRPDESLLPLAAPSAVSEVSRFDAATAAATPESRARAVAEAIAEVRSESQTAAGIFSTEETSESVLNSEGVDCRHVETLARFSITALGEGSSGWAKASAVSSSAFRPAELARRAARKAALSRNARELAPGRYTVILEPAAVLDLVGQIFADFSATALEDQRSFLNERLGTALFGPNITIDDDVHHPLQCGPAFDFEGVPRRRLALVESGVPREVARCRAAAARSGGEPTGHGFPVPSEFGEAATNIVIHGGDRTLEQLIASTERGILVTRLWYIREVDPYNKIMTGMTRDGTFWIEGGEVAYGVRNFRFNQSVVEMLRNVESMSPAERASGEEAFDMVVPAMKVHNFNFTEVTRF